MLLIAKPNKWILKVLNILKISAIIITFLKEIGLVRFYGISTIVGYLMPNPLYTYIKYIWFVNTYSWKHFKWVWHTVKWFQILQCISNNLSRYQSFVCSQLNNQTVLFLTIQYIISYFFAHSLNVEYYHYRSEWTWEQWQWRGTLHSPTLRDCKDIQWEGVLPLFRDTVGVF